MFLSLNYFPQCIWWIWMRCLRLENMLEIPALWPETPSSRFGYWSAFLSDGQLPTVTHSFRSPDQFSTQSPPASSLQPPAPSPHEDPLMDSTGGWWHRQATLLVFNELLCDFNAYLNVFSGYLSTGWRGVYAVT